MTADSTLGARVFRIRDVPLGTGLRLISRVLTNAATMC